MYHKIEMHISKFNNYLIFCEHFLEPNFFKGIHLAKPKKNELFNKCEHKLKTYKCSECVKKKKVFETCMLLRPKNFK